MKLRVSVDDLLVYRRSISGTEIQVPQRMWDAYTEALAALESLLIDIGDLYHEERALASPVAPPATDTVGDTSCTYCGGVHVTQCPHCSEPLPWDPIKHHCRLVHGATV